MIIVIIGKFFPDEVAAIKNPFEESKGSFIWMG